MNCSAVFNKEDKYYIFLDDVNIGSFINVNEKDNIIEEYEEEEEINENESSNGKNEIKDESDSNKSKSKSNNNNNKNDDSNDDSNDDDNNGKVIKNGKNLLLLLLFLIF